MKTRLNKFPMLGAAVLLVMAGGSRVRSEELYGSNTVDAIAIVVNDDPILLSDIRDARDQEYLKFQKLNPGVSEQDLRKALGGGSDRAVDELVRLSLIEQDAKRYGLGVTDFEVEDAIDRIRKGRGVTREQLGSDAAAQGMTWERYRREVRYAMLFDRIKMSLIRPRVSVTEAEVRAQYDVSFKNTVEEARVQMLFLPFADPSPAGRKKVTEQAGRIREQGVRGAEFSELVRLYSSGPNASRGGDIGSIKKGSILPFLEEAIFSTPKGEISQVLTDERGAYLLKIVDRTGGEAPAFDQLYNQIKSGIEGQKIEEAFTHYVEELVASARVQKNGAPESGS